MQGELRDKKDIPVLSDALYYEVDVILTGDKDFLEAKLEKPLIFSLNMMDEFLKNGKHDESCEDINEWRDDTRHFCHDGRTLKR